MGQLPPKELPQLRNINLLLSRAERISVTDVVEHDFILDYIRGQLSVSDSQHKMWPMARWRLAVETIDIESDSNHWLCADPVYIHPDRSEALLYAHEELDIQLDEAQALTELINQHYKDDPWQLHVGSCHRWYIELEKPFDLATSTLQLVKGNNVFDYLPSGEDGRYWQQCMNEVQMLLHSSDVNQQREAQGKMPVNSLWLWGYGSQEEHENLPWNHIYTNDAVLKGLGLYSGSEVDDLPESADGIVNDDDKVLVYYDKLQALSQQQDIYAWLTELQSLEDNWFEPLLDRVRKEAIQLTVLLDENEAYSFTGKHLRRWWRRSSKNKLF